MRIVLVAVLAVAVLTSCARTSGPHGPSTVVEAGIPLGPTPGVVASFCRARAQRHAFPVLCPTRYPRAGGGSVVTASGESMLGPSFYWASFNDLSGVADNGHVILGGQRPPFALSGSAGETWPRPDESKPVGQLNLPHAQTLQQADGTVFVQQRPARVVRRTMVHGEPGLVLAAAPYPAGGLHGDHLIVIWNHGGHGYFLSLHLEAGSAARDYTRSERLAAALAVAQSFERVSVRR